MLLLFFSANLFGRVRECRLSGVATGYWCPNMCDSSFIFDFSSDLLEVSFAPNQTIVPPLPVAPLLSSHLFKCNVHLPIIINQKYKCHHIMLYKVLTRVYTSDLQRRLWKKNQRLGVYGTPMKSWCFIAIKSTSFLYGKPRSTFWPIPIKSKA